MRSIARRTAVGAALLLVMPVAVWISGWRWQPGEQSWLLKAAFWVTETVTQPWGVITHLILFGWFLWCLRFRIKAAIMLFAILAAAILMGQGVKSPGSKTKSGNHDLLLCGWKKHIIFRLMSSTL